jgi:hypothetical protein
MMRKVFMKAVCGAVFAALLAASGLAQNDFRLGIFVTPVANAPMSATARLETARLLPDGSTERLTSVNHIARDSNGRIYNELRQLVPLDFTGTPPLISSHIVDPATRISTFLNLREHIARQSKQPGPGPDWEHMTLLPSVPPPVPGREPLVRQEDLGTQVMQDMTVRGVRITRTIPANSSGTGQPVVVTDEYWYSDDLHLNMLVKHDDPRSGQQTMTVMQLKRGEPDPQLFIIPSDYKVVDETPPTNK